MSRLANSPFKAYDLRGRVPDALNAERAQAIGRAYAAIIEPDGPIAIGQDIRSSSPELAQALADGLHFAGVDTLDIGLCGTEVVYHAASRPGMGGGIMVTASHNPADYNGMKMVRAGAVPISADTGLREIERLIAEDRLSRATSRLGRGSHEDLTDDYVRRMLSFVEPDRLRPMTVVVNAGNGCAGPFFDAIVQSLPVQVVRLHHQPDGRFPNGVPNPLLPENRSATSQAVRANGADFGIAWDGDFDRCFFFDEDGRFIEGYYLVGLFASMLLERNPGATVVIDPRLIWNSLELVEQAGGKAVINKSGHAFIKERMRKERALYGGEMSAHHYFRDFSYCDSGMLPWLLLAQMLSTSDRSLADLVNDRLFAYPCSGELNFAVAEPSTVLDAVLNAYRNLAIEVDGIDGISLTFPEWRMNLRASNTEPVIRLNIETQANQDLLAQCVEQVSELIESFD